LDPAWSFPNIAPAIRCGRPARRRCDRVGADGSAREIAETDRANLTAAPAGVFVDMFPGEAFPWVGALSGLATRAAWFESATVTRLFDVTFQFDKPDPRLKAGASARVVIDGKPIADALNVPRQAVIEKNGKTHVFVKAGDRFEQREVKVEHLTESRAAISGLDEGTIVALVDPTVARPTATAASPPCRSERLRA
jgi:multidrug efflux pump subunit AcrA (membrane-fusion protein)